MTKGLSTEQIARLIRNAFFEEKGRLMRRKYKPNPRHDQMAFYEKAAALCIELEADPDTFIRVCFEQCRLPQGPFANAIGGSAARGWYRQYIAGLNANEVQQAANETHGKDKQVKIREFTYPVDAEIQMEMDIVLSALKHNTGSTDPWTPKNASILRDPFYQLPISARGILACRDIEICKVFSRDIFEFYTTHPDYLTAARRWCTQNPDYQIDNTLQWISQYLTTSRK